MLLCAVKTFLDWIQTPQLALAVTQVNLIHEESELHECDDREHTWKRKRKSGVEEQDRVDQIGDIYVFGFSSLGKEYDVNSRSDADGAQRLTAFGDVHEHGYVCLDGIVQQSLRCVLYSASCQHLRHFRFPCFCFPYQCLEILWRRVWWRCCGHVERRDLTGSAWRWWQWGEGICWSITEGTTLRRWRHSKMDLSSERRGVSHGKNVLRGSNVCNTRGFAWSSERCSYKVG